MWERAISDQRLHRQLRPGRCLTEIQNLEKTGKGISDEERREWKKSARLQCCTSGRPAGPLTEIPYGGKGYQFREKDEGFGSGHSEFQAMAKQSKENVKHRVGRVRWGLQTVTDHIVKLVSPAIRPALYPTMAQTYVSWESMVIALYDILLKTCRIPSHTNVLNLPFNKAPLSTNLIKSFKTYFLLHLVQHFGILSFSYLQLTKGSWLSSQHPETPTES